MKKKQLGQFFTTNAEYILNGLETFIKCKDVIDPFAGDGDLLDWAMYNGALAAHGFDVDESKIKGSVSYNDSLNNPLEYDFVIANPPYLNVNKADEACKSKYFLNSNYEDLYQISIDSILKCKEGILIVPLNFLCAENSKKLRQKFFSKYQIIKLNYFQERVFADTTINVVAFYFKEKSDLSINCNSFPAIIHPKKKTITIEIKEEYDWQIGGEFLSLINKQENRLKIRRLTEKDIITGAFNCKKVKLAYSNTADIREFELDESILDKIQKNIILLKAIDSGSEAGKIALEDINGYGVCGLVSKNTSRHQIQLIFGVNISIDEQKKLINLFNQNLEELREKYFSLFLTNYRDNDRKRISFDFVYKYLNWLWEREVRIG